MTPSTRTHVAHRGARAALADGRVRRLLASDAISGSADAMYWLALIVVLSDHTDGTGWVAAAVIARLAPRLLFGAVGGAVADRFDRRRLLIVLDGARGLLMLLLALVIAVGGQPVVVIALVFVVGAIGTPYRPAVCASIPHLVDESILGATNAVWSTVGQAINLFGPLLGLALLAVGPPWWAFAVNAASFGCSVVLIGLISTLGRASSPRTDGVGRGAHIADGWRSIRQHRGLSALVGIVAVFTMLRGFELVLYVRVATDLLGLGAAGYGWLAAAAGIGAIAVAPLTMRGRLDRRPTITLLLSSLIGCASMASLAWITRPGIAIVAVAIAGAGIVVFEVAALTLVQLISPPDAIGRIVGIQNSVSGTAKLAGAMLAPACVAVLGLRGALVLVATALAAVMIATSRNLGALRAATAEGRDRLAPIIQTLAPLDLFVGVPTVAIERLALTAVDEDLPSDAVILREGDPADDFFVIRSGRLLVSIDGREVGVLEPGDAFGELGLLNRAPRAATVRAADGAVVMRFPGEEFLRAVTASHATVDPLLSDLLEKPATSEQRPQREG